MPAAKRAPFSLPLAACLVGLLLLNGCSITPPPPNDSNRPAEFSLPSSGAVLPARLVGNHFVIEIPRPRRDPWRFLVDTGSSVTLVSAEFARREGVNARRFTHAPKRVRSVTGNEASFDAVLIKQIRLGNASFSRIPALVFDPSEISNHLGVKIDGIIGFPFFLGTEFTLDYVRRELRVGPAPREAQTNTVGYVERYRTPRISARLGGTAVEALLDSGSDASLVLPSLDPQLALAEAPRPGGTVGGLVGTMTSEVARLASPLEVAGFAVPTPAVTLGAPHIAIGADILRDFAVTFDTTHQRVRFEVGAQGVSPARAVRHLGLSFDKTPAYWRVESVLPGSPARDAGLRAGDLVVRLEGEPIANWPLDRFLELVRTRDKVVINLLHGSRETPVIVPVFTLLPAPGEQAP